VVKLLRAGHQCLPAGLEQKTMNRETRGAEMKRVISLILIALVMAILLPCLPCGCSAPRESTEARAAIVDQLYNLQPNEAFISYVTQQLNNLHLEVDIYQGDEITVDFFQKLPSYGYRFIVFRVHSGLLTKEEEMAQGTWLFTNEQHNPMKYTDQRLVGRIVKARTGEQQPWVFAIGADFITENTAGQFDNTVIIMMGCFSLYINDLARAFIMKGANTYLGWNGNLSLEYVDEATTKLIRNLSQEEMTIKEAVDKVMADMGPSPVYNAQLIYYPARNENKTIDKLVR
jgi:hypothetical protein